MEFNTAASSSNGFLNGKTVFQQLVIGIVVLIILYLFNIAVESMYKYLVIFSHRKVILVENTLSSANTKQLVMNPNVPNVNSIYLSDNERTGPEFSYSFFVNIDPSTFGNEFGLKHIMHKGYPKEYPLLCPGVFMRNDTNTMRIYINSYKTWNNFVEVENFPVGKFVHVVIVVSNGLVEVFVNGNLTNKLSLDGTSVYQNYQDIYIFSPYNGNLLASQIPSLNGQNFTVLGTATGMISRLKYFNYCLGYNEITQLLEEGPSSRMESQSMGASPPYLADTWWTTRYR